MGWIGMGLGWGGVVMMIGILGGGSGWVGLTSCGVQRGGGRDGFVFGGGEGGYKDEVREGEEWGGMWEEGVDWLMERGIGVEWLLGRGIGEERGFGEVEG